MSSQDVKQDIYDDWSEPVLELQALIRDIGETANSKNYQEARDMTLKLRNIGFKLEVALNACVEKDAALAAAQVEHKSTQAAS